jgi:hypothetical protein
MGDPVTTLAIVSAVTAGSQMQEARKTRKKAEGKAQEADLAQRNAMAKEKERMRVADLDAQRDAQRSIQKQKAAALGGRQSTILTQSNDAGDTVPRKTILGV